MVTYTHVADDHMWTSMCWNPPSPVLCCVCTAVGSWYQLLGPLQFEPLCRFSMVNFSYIIRASEPPWREIKIKKRPLWVSCPPFCHLWLLSPSFSSLLPPGKAGKAQGEEGGVHIAWVHTWSALWWISLMMTDRNGVSYMPAVVTCVCYTLVC